VWRPGSKLVHPYNPELGVGLVRAVDGRFLDVYFPHAEREMRLAAEASGLERLRLSPGAHACLLATGEEVVIERGDGERYRLRDGRVVDDAELFPVQGAETPIERLVDLRVDPVHDFRNRWAGLELMRLREAGGLGSFLGGRIELFPHQLFTAQRAVAHDPVRWLLADEVGLGKTIEACLILSALIRTGRAERALVLAPDSLVVQWLGELYRKFHQVFVWIDAERVDAVRREVAEDANPFDVHPFAIVSHEMLAGDPSLAALARACAHDLLVVDEAHRLSVAETEHALAPLVRAARHALLLTATPLQADRAGFHRLLAMLHPDHFDELADFERAIAAGEVRVPCTSAVRRADLGGLPPRDPRPVDLEAPTGSELRADPRADWLARRIPRWRERGEKALVFVGDAGRLGELKRTLETRTRMRLAEFHADLPTAQRDIEVAQFRETGIPALLCTDAAAEGRNFQFCTRMVHYDLPLDPVVLEQRIGRLDRIGRTRPVEIVYFRAPAGSGLDLARLYERLDLFARPSAGLEHALLRVRDALVRGERDGGGIDETELVAAVERARSKGEADLPRVLYADAYRPEHGPAVLSWVPGDLEARTREFSLGAASSLGLEVVEKGGEALWYLAFGAGATVDTLPGVPADARYLGTFSRGEAVRREEIDFFASGHPLVEGLLLELCDGPRGRAALFELDGLGTRRAGLLLLFKHGPATAPVVLDRHGRERPDWIEPLRAGLARARPIRPTDRTLDARWRESIHTLAARAAPPHPGATLEAAAFFRSTS
jgi:ATP-dependent helicase HepA